MQRLFFTPQLAERMRKAFLHVRPPFLEINRLECAEQVCLPARRTGERISALGAQRSGFGRCGEESTFAVNVAASLPAFRRGRCIRPAGRTAMITTPGARRSVRRRVALSRRVRAGGRELDRGWFTGAASRAASGAQPLLRKTRGRRYGYLDRRRGNVSEPDGALCARSDTYGACARTGWPAVCWRGGDVRHCQRVGNFSGGSPPDRQQRCCAALLRLWRSGCTGAETRAAQRNALPGRTADAGVDACGAGDAFRPLGSTHIPCAEGALAREKGARPGAKGAHHRKAGGGK